MNVFLAQVRITAVGFLMIVSIAEARVQLPLRTQSNMMVEVAFTSQRSHTNPFLEVQLDVQFTDPNGATKKAPAFWAGGQTWKVRYTSPLVGVHRFRTMCSDSVDSGLESKEGSIEIEPYEGTNPLFLHGQLRVSSDHRHFEHNDGTPFFWLADTWWKCLSKRLTFHDFQELTADRVSKGFTAVQIVCGPYPDEQPFQPIWENEGGKPYKSTDFKIVNPSYFEFADQRFAHLIDSGVVPVIVGGWGRGDCDAMRMAGPEGLARHWRYLVARYWAYPTVWIVGGEAQGPEWTKVALMIRSIDPCDRPISIHPQQSGRLSVTDDKAINFDMLQTGHGDMTAGKAAIPQIQGAVDRKPAMPALIGEFCYEGHMQSAFQDVERHVFWASMLSGAAGLTYGAAGIWHASIDGDPGVQDGPGVHRVYDLTTWKEGMNYPGSTEIGLGKRLLTSMAWSRFLPHAEWAEPDSFAAGIPNDIRVIYQPRRRVYNWAGTVVHGIEVGTSYHATYFDPVRGKQFEMGDFVREDPEQTSLFKHSQSTLFEDKFDGSMNARWSDIGSATTRENHKLIGHKAMLSVLPKIIATNVTASVEGRSDAELGIVLRYHDKDNYVVALYSPLLHAIYIHDRRNGEWGDYLGKVAVPELEPAIRLTVTANARFGILELRDGKHVVTTQSVHLENISAGSSGLWMYQIGDRQEFANFRLSRADGKLSRPVILTESYRAPDLPSPQDWVLILRKIK